MGGKVVKYIRYKQLSFRKLLKGCEGFIYIDVIVGMLILVTALTFMGGTYSQAVGYSMSANQNTVATSIARQALESLKDQDNIQQVTPGTSIFTLPAPMTQTINGITYTVTTTVVNLGNTLGNVTDVITPVQIAVTWKNKPTDAANTTLTMFGYYGIKPKFTTPFTPNADSPATKNTRFAFYKNHGKAGVEGAMQHLYSPNNGYFYTRYSNYEKLWSQYYNDIYGDLDKDINVKDNRAVTNNWGADGDILQFDKLTIPASAAGYCDVFSFQVRNDGSSYADYANPNYIDPTQWGLPSGYTTFTFDIYLTGTYTESSNNSSASSLKNPNSNNTQTTKYLIAKDVQVIASDKDFNGPTAGSGTAYTIDIPVTVQDPTDAKKTITVTATVKAVVIKGSIELIGLPAGSNYSIGLQWKIDQGNTSTDKKSGTDANALIANISLKKGKI